MLEMKMPINRRFIVIQVLLYCLCECCTCMMNFNYHYFQSVLFYKPQGTLGFKYEVNKYRKILKISLGAYIFQTPFLRRLFLEGLVFGGAYLRREICVSKSIGLALYLEVNLPFLLCFTLNLRAIFQVLSPGRLIFGGAI